jgi:predicted O-methyltransferase YrrM
MHSYRSAASCATLLLQLKLMRDPGPNRLVDFVFSNPIIAPAQVRSELLRFAAIIAELKPSLALEIGTARGGTLCVISRLSRTSATIISVDLPGGLFGGGYRWFRIPIYKSFPVLDQKLHLIRGDSHDQAIQSRVREEIGKDRKLDLLFIDGDHSYQGVRADFDSYRSLVRSGGIIAFHDIAEHPKETGCEVARLWQEVKTQYRHEEIIEDRDQGWAGIGILYVD